MKKCISLILAIVMVFSVFGGNLPYVFAQDSSPEQSQPESETVQTDAAAEPSQTDSVGLSDTTADDPVSLDLIDSQAISNTKDLEDEEDPTGHYITIIEHSDTEITLVNGESCTIYVDVDSSDEIYYQWYEKIGGSWQEIEDATDSNF